MSMIKHFRDEGGPSLSISYELLKQQKVDKAELIRLIHRYKTAKPFRAKILLVGINRIINKYMGGY